MLELSFYLYVVEDAFTNFEKFFRIHHQHLPTEVVFAKWRTVVRLNI